MQQAPVEPIIEARNLTTRFDIKSGMFGRISGRVHAVENVSFHVEPRETLSLVGESGCGKSVTAMSVLGLWVMFAGGEDAMGGVFADRRVASS